VKKKKDKFTFIDLFAGCGGLSEGFYRQGFKALTHVEFAFQAFENPILYQLQLLARVESQDLLNIALESHHHEPCGSRALQLIQSDR
jgi:hypothetical protein